MRILFLALLLSVPAIAHAECPPIYSGDSLINDLQTLQFAMRNVDEGAFLSAGKRLDQGIGCMANPVPTPVFATAYRYIGTYHYLTKDNDGARKWFRSSLELNPTYEWDAQELEEDNPMRAVFEEERAHAHADSVKIEGKIIAQPAGSSLTIDGKPLVDAAASPDRPHVIQQIGTGDRAVRGTFIVEGNNFPPQFLADKVLIADAPIEAEKKKKEAKKKEKTITSNQFGDNGVVKLERMRPPEKTPLMILGAAAIVGAGGIYAASFIARDQFEHSGTSDELTTGQTTTNALVLASGGALLVGAGIGYWGIVLDGGAGVGFAGHF